MITVLTFPDLVTRHYQGDDRDLPVLAAGILQAFAGITVEDFEAQADTFLRDARHPTLGRGYLACAYTPMVELLGHLAAAGTSNGDLPMLAFAEQPRRPSLRLLVLHDNPEREFDYVAGAGQALQLASTRGWTVVSIRDDWTTVF